MKSKSCNNISIDSTDQIFNSNMCTSINCLCENENKTPCKKYERSISEQKCLTASIQPNNNYPSSEKNVSAYPQTDQCKQNSVAPVTDNECVFPQNERNSGLASSDATATLTLSSEITPDLLAPYPVLSKQTPNLASSQDNPDLQNVVNTVTYPSHSSSWAPCFDQPEQFQLYSPLDPDHISYNEDDIYKVTFSDEPDNQFYSIEQDLKAFHDKHYSSDDSFYPNVEVNNLEYFVECFEPSQQISTNNVITEPLTLSSSPSINSTSNDEIFESDDETMSMSSQETYYSDQFEEDSMDTLEDDESGRDDDGDHPSDSHDSEAKNENKVNKTTLNYKSQLNYDRFHIPQQDPIIDAYEDKRDFLSVARDCLRIIEGKMNKDECIFLSQIAGFDISSPSYHRHGFAKLKSELVKEAQQYKELNKLSPRDQKRADDVIDAAKKAKGLLPKDVVRSGYSPSANKDYVDKKFCDENYEGKGLFDEDDPVVNSTQTAPLNCHCRSFKHHIQACPNQGQFCDSVQCLEISNDDFPELNYVFECLCHPIKPLSPFNAPPDEPDNIHHLHITDPSYVIQLHNPLVPKIHNMERREKGFMKRVKTCNFHLQLSLVKQLERLYLKYFPELPKKDLFPKTTPDSLCKEINLSTSNQPKNELSYLKTQIGIGNFVSKKSCSLLLDSGSQINILRQSTLKDLNIPTDGICTEVTYLLKTADGKKSNAALGSICLNLFFHNQQNTPISVRNVVFIVVTDEFKMSNLANVGIIGSSFLRQIDASIKYLKNAVTLSGKFTNVNDDIIHTSILCQDQHQLTQCHAVSLQISEDKGQFCGKLELKLPELEKDSIYHLYPQNHALKDDVYICHLPASSYVTVKNKNNISWPMSIQDTVTFPISFSSKNKDKIPTEIDELNSIKFDLVEYNSDSEYLNYLKTCQTTYRINKQTDYWPEPTSKLEEEEGRRQSSRQSANLTPSPLSVSSQPPSHSSFMGLKQNFLNKPFSNEQESNKEIETNNVSASLDFMGLRKNFLNKTTDSSNKVANDGWCDNRTGTDDPSHQDPCVPSTNIPPVPSSSPTVSSLPYQTDDTDQDKCSVHYMHSYNCEFHSQIRTDCGHRNVDINCICPQKMNDKELEDYYLHKQDCLDNPETLSSYKVTANPFSAVEEKKYTFTADSYRPADSPIDSKLLDKNDLMQLAADKKYRVDISHLSGDFRDDVNNLINKYKSTFASDQHRVGRFLPYKVQLRLSDDKNTKQSDRRINFTKHPEAKEKVEYLIKIGVLDYVSPENPLTAISNFVLVPKNNMEGIRSNSKADKHLAKNQNALTYRLTADLKLVNAKLIGPTYIRLPLEFEVRQKIIDCYCTIIDLADGYTSIMLTTDSYKYVTVYFERDVIFYKRLTQGLSTAPHSFTECLRYTFADKAFLEIMQKLKWSQKDFPFTRFDEFLEYYLDDFCVFTKRHLGHRMHLKCLTTILEAIKIVGLLASPSKTQILVEQFEFIGKRFVTTENYSCLSPNRAKTILNMRPPLSCGELASRLSFFSYSLNYLPHMRKIALPLHRVVATAKFKWGRLQAEAWNNLKFMSILGLRNYAFDPERPAYLCVDSSRLAAGFILTQADDDNMLQPITMGSTMLSVSETRQYAPEREAGALAWAITQIEPYLLNTNSQIVAFTDSQPLSFISQCKKWCSKYYNLSVALSAYKALTIGYIPGKFLVAADCLSRNIQNAIVKEDNTISEQFAKIALPLPTNLRNKVLTMSNQEFQNYLMSNIKVPLIDIQPSAYNYTQRFDSNLIPKLLKETTTESALFQFLSDPWSNKNLYQLSLFTELAGLQKTLNKTSYEKILKDYKLKGLKEKLDQLGFSPSYFNSLKINFEKKDQEQAKENLQKLNVKKHCAASAVQVYINKVSAITRLQTKKSKTKKHQNTSAATPGSAQPGPPAGLPQPGQTRPHTRSQGPIPDSTPPSTASPNAHPPPTTQRQQLQQQDNINPCDKHSNLNASPPPPPPPSREGKGKSENIKAKLQSQNKCSPHQCQHNREQFEQNNEEFEDCIKYLVNLDLFSKITALAENFSKCFYEKSDPDNKKIMNYIENINMSQCLIEKMYHFRLLVARLFTMINSANVRLGTKSSPPLTPFVYVFNSEHCAGKLGQQQFSVYNKNTIQLEPYQSVTLLMQYFNSLKNDMELEMKLPENIHTEVDMISDDCGTMIRRVLLINLTNQNISIEPDQLIFTLQLSKNPEERFVSMQADPTFIQNRLTNLSNFSTMLNTEKYENILSKYVISNKYSLRNQLFDGVDSAEKEMITQSVEQMGNAPHLPRLRTGCDLYFQLKNSHQYRQKIGPDAPPTFPNSTNKVTLDQIKKLASPWSNLDQMTELNFNSLNEASRNALNSLIINKSLTKTGGIFDQSDIFEIQRNSPTLKKLVRLAEQKKDIRYVLVNDILYRKDTPRNSQVETMRLVLPESLTFAIFQTLHSSQFAHLSPSAMNICFSSLFYCPNSLAVATRASSSCISCIFGRNRNKINIPGSVRTFDQNMSPGSHIVCDTLILPRSTSGVIGLQLFCCSLSSYISVVPIKAVNAKNSCNSLRTYLSMHNNMHYLSVDRGPEFNNTQFMDLCAKFNIAVISPLASHSNSQSHAESAIAYYKQLLSKAVQSCTPGSRDSWTYLVPFITQAYNSSRMQGSNFCRVSMRYSPLCRINNSLSPAILNDEADLATLHKSQLQHIQDRRRHALFHNYHFSKTSPLAPGAVCLKTLTRQQHRTINKSKQLLNNVKDLIVVLSGPHGLVYHTKSLLDQDESWSHRRQLERVTVNDFFGFNLSSEELFKNIATARINRSYKRLSKGLYLSARPVSHKDRNNLEFTWQASDADHEADDDGDRDQEEEDPPPRSASVHQTTIRPLSPSKNHQTQPQQLKSILKVKTPPPPSYFLMSTQEIKALFNGIRLYKELCAYYGISLPDQIEKVQLVAQKCLLKCKGVSPHFMQIHQANFDLQQSNPFNPTPSRVSFDPKLFYSGTQRKTRDIYNAHAILLSWKTCSSLKEIALHQNLYE